MKWKCSRCGAMFDGNDTMAIAAHALVCAKAAKKEKEKEEKEKKK